MHKKSCLAAQLDANLEAAREAYARLYESPTAEDIIKLRSEYGASQKAFGLILGLGELTINSYEHGSSLGPREPPAAEAFPEPRDLSSDVRAEPD